MAKRILIFAAVVMARQLSHWRQRNQISAAPGDGSSAQFRSSRKHESDAPRHPERRTRSNWKQN